MSQDENNNLRDILRALELGAEEQWESKAKPVIKHFSDTWKMSLFWAVVLFGFAFVYIFVASWEYNSNPAATSAFSSHSLGYNLVYIVGVALLLLATAMFTLTSARVGLYSGVLMLFEAIAIPVVEVSYSITSVLIPDWVEEKLDAKGKIEKLLLVAYEERRLRTVAEDIIRGYMGGVAWALFAPWLLISLPLVVFQNPLYVLMSLVVGIAILIYQTIGFRSDPFWYDLIQQGAMYAAAGHIIFYMVVMPIVNTSGAFEGWGPPGYARTALWFVVFVIAAAIVGSGATLRQSTETGKRRVDLKAAHVFAAAVIVIAALLFGNLLLTKVAKATTPSQSSSTVPPGSAGSSGSTQVPPEMNQNAGPYYNNASDELVQGKAYKFASNNRVYIYEDGKLRPVANERAYFTYYGCPGGQRVIDCAPVYEMPGSINPGSSILHGRMID